MCLFKKKKLNQWDKALANYSPTPTHNNLLKDLAVEKIERVLDIIRNNQYNNNLNIDNINSISENLEYEKKRLKDSIGYNGCNIREIARAFDTALFIFNNSLNQDYDSGVSNSAEVLFNKIRKWEQILLGNENGSAGFSEMTQESWREKQVKERCEELRIIGSEFDLCITNVTRDIIRINTQISELKRRIQNTPDNEANELNELASRYRSKENELHNQQEIKKAYVSCRGIVDNIYGVAKGLINGIDINDSALSSASKLLDIGRIRNIMGRPVEAEGMLIRIKTEIDKLKPIGTPGYSRPISGTVLSDDAKALKAKLKEEVSEKSGKQTSETGNVSDINY